VHGPDARHVLFDIAVPTSAKHMRVYFFLACNFDHHVPDADLLAPEAATLAQDRPALESQHPEQLPLDLGAEFHQLVAGFVVPAFAVSPAGGLRRCRRH
jgi:hypothetical protein